MDQTQEIERVSARIGQAVVLFMKEKVGGEFHAQELRDFVTQTTGITAPGSADRIMRDLRQKGKIAYTLISRSKSLYRSEG